MITIYQFDSILLLQSQDVICFIWKNAVFIIIESFLQMFELGVDML